ncbi:hypothetical protein PU345_002991 [Enterobacter kobei]|nr:hypothetical protein [Enterobacter kobei]
MNKHDMTVLRLQEALGRILTGKPVRIMTDRKLSVRAVEDEAGLGNGSAYYYPDIVNKIRYEKHLSTIRTSSAARSGNAKWKEKALEAERLKTKFSCENKTLKELNASIAANQYKQLSALRNALERIAELEKEVISLKEELVKTKRCNIKSV